MRTAEVRAPKRPLLDQHFHGRLLSHGELPLPTRPSRCLKAQHFLPFPRLAPIFIMETIVTQRPLITRASRTRISKATTAIIAAK